MVSFVKNLNEKTLHGLKLKARCKRTGKIYPVYEIDLDTKQNDGKIYFLVMYENERIKKHQARGEHWCCSCGTVWPDHWCGLDEVDILIDGIDIRSCGKMVKA